MIRLFLLLAALGLCLPACGGRATLSSDSGKASKRIWATQADSQPRDKLASMSAADATIAMRNHGARYGKGKASGGQGGGGFGFGGGGQLTPATTDLSALGLGGGDEGGGPGNRKISLQAK